MTKNKKHSDDIDLFQNMMSDVTPLTDKDRVLHKKSPPTAFKPPTISETSHSNSFISHDYVEHINPEENLFFSHPGLQRREIRRLKRGDIAIEATVDLHGLTINEAGVTLAHFLNMARLEGLRCICVIHGKGYRSVSGQPVLKTQVNHWLRDAPDVLAFSSTRAKDGGMGSLYVLLRRR